MVRMVWLQFKHSWKIWMSALVLFIVIGFLSGISLTGLFSIMSEQNHIIVAENNPTPIFLMPMFFGGLTLFFVLSSVIESIIHYFHEEYRLWLILGSNPLKLSGLISGQVAIVGACGGLLGYIVSVPFVSFIYHWLQAIVGYEMLPTIQLGFSLFAFLGTITFAAFLGGMAGFNHGRRLFSKIQFHLFHSDKGNQTKFRLISWVLLIASVCLLSVCFYILFNIKTYPAITDPGTISLLICFMILFILLIILNILSRALLPMLVKSWTSILFKSRLTTIDTAYWHVLKERDYLRALIHPLIIGAVLLTSFSAIMINMISHLSNQGIEEQAIENILIFILYLGAPLLIILTNVIVISIFASKQQLSNVKQLLLLGYTPKGVLLEKIAESFIYAGTFLLATLCTNLVMMIAITKGTLVINSSNIVSWKTVISWPSVIAVVIFIVLCLIQMIQLNKVRHETFNR